MFSTKRESNAPAGFSKARALDTDASDAAQGSAHNADLKRSGAGHFLVKQLVKKLVKETVQKSRVSDDTAAVLTPALQSAAPVENAAALLQRSSAWLQHQVAGIHQADYQRFWQFSLAMYPNWQQQLLRLQDQYHARVNLLLLLAFVAQPQAGAATPDTNTPDIKTPDIATPDTASHRHSEPPAARSVAEPLAATQLSDVLDVLLRATEPTQQQLLPLRAQRRLLDKAKPDEAVLRQQMLALELAIEQQEQHRLINAWFDVSRLYLADIVALECCDHMPQSNLLATAGRWLLDFYLSELQLPNRAEIHQLLLG